MLPGDELQHLVLDMVYDIVWNEGTLYTKLIIAVMASCFLNQIRIIAGTKTNKRKLLCFHKITTNVYPIVMKMKKKKFLVKLVKCKLSINRNPIMPESDYLWKCKGKRKAKNQSAVNYCDFGYQVLSHTLTFNHCITQNLRLVLNSRTFILIRYLKLKYLINQRIFNKGLLLIKYPRNTRGLMKFKPRREREK